MAFRYYLIKSFTNSLPIELEHLFCRSTVGLWSNTALFRPTIASHADCICVFMQPLQLHASWSKRLGRKIILGLLKVIWLHFPLTWQQIKVSSRPRCFFVDDRSELVTTCKLFRMHHVNWNHLSSCLGAFSWAFVIGLCPWIWCSDSQLGNAGCITQIPEADLEYFISSQWFLCWETVSIVFFVFGRLCYMTTGKQNAFKRNWCKHGRTFIDSHDQNLFWISGWIAFADHPDNESWLAAGLGVRNCCLNITILGVYDGFSLHRLP